MRWIAAAVMAMAAWQAAWATDIGEAVGPLALETLDGRPLTLDNYGERRGTVIAFLSARSDAVEAAAAEINRVHQRFRLREVLWVGVVSNPEETGDEIRTYAQRRGMVFPLYRDPSGAAARRLGARLTPEVFLLDRSGVLLYRGAVDPGAEPGGVEAAVESLLAGQVPDPAQTDAQGTPLDRPGPPRDVEDPYGAPWFASELVFERIPGAPAHHCSTVTETAEGDLLCLWYGGSYESAEDQVLFLSRRPAGSRAWTAPEVLIENPGQPPGNAVIFKDGLDRIWVVWGRMESTRPLRRGAGWSECRLFRRISTDHGRTWSDDVEWPGSFGWLPRNAPVTLDDGTLLLPLSGRVEGQNASFFMMTSDHGETWERSGLIDGGSQPTAVQRADGSILALMRSEPHLLRSESRDGGRTWSAPESSGIVNPNAGAALWRLENGHLVLVFNNTPEGRTPLSVARSTDDGATWEAPRALESNPGEYSYPCAIQTRDGRIHVTYTFRRYSIMHAEFNEDWLVHAERPN